MGIMDMMDMMKQAKAVSEKMQAAQEAVTKLEVTGCAGIEPDTVTVRINGRYDVLAVTVAPSLLGKTDKESVEMLQDLIAAAFNDAVQKVASETKNKMGDAMGGFKLPPGFKLPF